VRAELLNVLMMPDYYAAFVNDLHQNNVEAVWHAPDPVIDAPHRPGVP